MSDANKIAAGTTVDATATKEKKSVKSKEALGIPADHKVSWVPFPMNPATNKVIDNIVAVRKLDKKTDFFVDIISKYLQENATALQTEAATYVAPEKSVGAGTARKSIDDMSVEELEAAAKTAEARQLAASNRAKLLLEAAKARAAAAQASAPVTETPAV